MIGKGINGYFKKEGSGTMFLTKECDYAIRIVRSLSGMNIKSVRAICTDENMPHPFAYKILKKLEHAQIVKPFRGSTGGYQLVKEPEIVTMLDIVSAVDDHLYLNECLQEGYVCDNNRNGVECGVHQELNRIQAMLIEALSEKPMTQLV